MLGAVYCGQMYPAGYPLLVGAWDPRNSPGLGPYLTAFWADGSPGAVATTSDLADSVTTSDLSEVW
jgi:hypothetical protein